MPAPTRCRCGWGAFNCIKFFIDWEWVYELKSQRKKRIGSLFSHVMFEVLKSPFVAFLVKLEE